MRSILLAVLVVVGGALVAPATTSEAKRCDIFPHLRTVNSSPVVEPGETISFQLGASADCAVSARVKLEGPGVSGGCTAKVIPGAPVVCGEISGVVPVDAGNSLLYFASTRSGSIVLHIACIDCP